MLYLQLPEGTLTLVHSTLVFLSESNKLDWHLGQQTHILKMYKRKTRSAIVLITVPIQSRICLRDLRSVQKMKQCVSLLV